MVARDAGPVGDAAEEEIEAPEVVSKGGGLKMEVR